MQKLDAELTQSVASTEMRVLVYQLSVGWRRRSSSSFYTKYIKTGQTAVSDELLRDYVEHEQQLRVSALAVNICNNVNGQSATYPDTPLIEILVNNANYMI